MLTMYSKSMTTTGINCTHVNEWDRGRLICVDCANKARESATYDPWAPHEDGPNWDSRNPDDRWERSDAELHHMPNYQKEW